MTPADVLPTRETRPRGAESAICTDDEAELAAIDENLVRAELTAAQRTEATTRRRELWERVRQAGNQVAQLVPPEIGYGKPPPQVREFAAETAAITGENKSTINRHLSRGEALKDVLPRIVNTSLAAPNNPRSHSVKYCNDHYRMAVAIGHARYNRCRRFKARR